MDAKLIMTAEQIQNRDVWLEQRKQGIGGTDAACIIGMNQWKSAYKMWAEKLGLIKEEDKSDNEAIHFGQIHEQVVADEFELRTGKKVRRCGLYQNSEKPFMLASIDRLVVGENAGLECKTASSYLAGEWEGDNIPDSYYVQCLHYMAVCGFDTYYIACLIGGNHFVWKTIKREDVVEDITSLVEAETKFWNENIQKQIAPPVDGSKTCTTVLNEKYTKLNNEVTMQMDSQMETICKDIKQLEAEAKTLTTLVDQKKNELRSLMEDCPKAVGIDYRVSYAFQKGHRVLDTDALISEHPDIDLDKYYTQGESRVLRIAKQKMKKI